MRYSVQRAAVGPLRGEVMSFNEHTWIRDMTDAQWPNVVRLAAAVGVPVRAEETDKARQQAAIRRVAQALEAGPGRVVGG